MPRGRPKTKREVATALRQHDLASAPAPHPHAIPQDLPEAHVRLAVLAYRKAGPLETLLINHALQLPTLSDANAKATRDEMRLLLNRMEGV